MTNNMKKVNLGKRIRRDFFPIDLKVEGDYYKFGVFEINYYEDANGSISVKPNLTFKGKTINQTIEDVKKDFGAYRDGDLCLIYKYDGKTEMPFIIGDLGMEPNGTGHYWWNDDLCEQIAELIFLADVGVYTYD